MTIERWIYLNKIIITSAGNEENFHFINDIFGGLFFCIEKWFSKSTHHAEKSQNCKPLIENDSFTSNCNPMELPDGRLTKKTMEKPAITSDLVYFELLFLIHHHIHSPLGQLKNSVSYVLVDNIFHNRV